MRIKRISTTVETEADLARMRLEENKYKHVIELMGNLSTKRGQPNERTRYLHIPLLKNNRFSGRLMPLTKIESVLDPTPNDNPSLRSMALFGMGGVGKTQLASQYAHESTEKYDVILWILADNSITIGQSFRDIARGLQLYEDSEEVQDSAAAIWKVKNWLGSTNSTWLVVFDNADDLQALKVAWPATAKGSILLTTRDFDLARNPAAECLQLDPFDEVEGCAMLLKQIGLDPTDAASQQHGIEITRALGGLPLALSQIGGFDDYEHTLSTVWDVSFERLPADSTKLLNIIIFFDPDSIDEDILSQGSQNETDLDPQFKFLTDEMDLGDAEAPLLQLALVNKSFSQPILSLHRLVQYAAIRKLSDSDKSLYFDVAIRLLSWGFPDTWSKDIGHQIGAWERCEKCLPHIDHLAKLVKRHSVRTSSGDRYAELLLRCTRGLVDAARNTFEDKSTLTYASAIDLAGLIDLDMCQPARALEPFLEALEIRKARLGADDAFIAFSLNNIALAYTEMGRLEEAYSTHQQAIDIRLLTNSDRIGNSYSNMASLLLRMGKPNEAQDMLARCPSLKDFTDDTFLSTGNPRFSGDMVLLSRIRLKQGRIDDALRLASKALAFRQKLLGNRLKTRLDDHTAAAIELLKQLIDIAGALVEGEGQLARALYKLSILYSEKGAASEADLAKAKATEIRNRLRPENCDAAFDGESFSKLTLWMLW
ncbi:TPR-like protein [Astrocystis sublimbata]|nr:TPR-like protein [Astrocystis sublimbata]